MATIKVAAAPPSTPGVGGSSGLIDVCDLTAGLGIQPAAYVTVMVRAAAGSSPDANGNFMHLRIEFAHPETRRGKRTAVIPRWAPTGDTSQQEQLILECDPGRYFLGSRAAIRLVGGTPGDSYEVQAWAQCIRDTEDPDAIADLMEPPVNYALTWYLSAPPSGLGIFPTPPPYHTHVWAITGTLLYPAAGTTSTDGTIDKIPFATNDVKYTTAGIFRTGSGETA